MERLKAATSTNPRIVDPVLFAESPRMGEILLNCLHGVQAISAYFLPGLPYKGLGGTNRGNSCHSPDFRATLDSGVSLGSSNPASFAGRLQILLERKFVQAVRQFFSASGKRAFLKRRGLTRIARLGRSAPPIAGSESSGGQMLLDRANLLGCRLSHSHTGAKRETAAIDSFPLIKASPVAVSGEQSVHPGCMEKQCASYDFAGRCILCVGGRAALYPEYRRLVETSGGKLLIYRNAPQGNEVHLPALLSCVDMVVCPVDCINHQAFFAVKRYCKHTGKPCVLLDRSGLPTFRKGIAALAAFTAASPVQSDKSIQSAKSPPTKSSQPAKCRSDSRSSHQ